MLTWKTSGLLHSYRLPHRLLARRPSPSATPFVPGSWDRESPTQMQQLPLFWPVGITLQQNVPDIFVQHLPKCSALLVLSILVVIFPTHTKAPVSSNMPSPIYSGHDGIHRHAFESELPLVADMPCIIGVQLWDAECGGHVLGGYASVSQHLRPRFPGPAPPLADSPWSTWHMTC